jgi:signal transduction histidine kinase
MKAMAAGKSEEWIINFTKQLYSELDRTHIITHARKSLRIMREYFTHDIFQRLLGGTLILDRRSYDD